MRGIQIIIDATENVVDLLPFDGSFDDVSRIVGGSVECAPTDGRVTVFVNEEGKLLRLPANIVADAAWSLFDSHGCIEHGDNLCGNVVIVGANWSDLDESTTLDVLAQIATLGLSS